MLLFVVVLGGEEMDYARMLFASEVRKLAIQMRNEARAALGAGVDGMPMSDATAEELARTIGEWDDKNPVENFVPKAFRHIDEIAKVIDSIPKK